MTRSWPALLLAPVTALGQQSICLALTELACHQQSTWTLHVVSAVSLLLILLMTGLAASEWLGARRSLDPALGRTGVEQSSRARQPAFLTVSGTLVGALSALVAVMMWMPVWALGPCAS